MNARAHLETAIASTWALLAVALLGFGLRTHGA